MDAPIYPGEIRRIVKRTLVEFGVTMRHLAELSECLLVQDGRCYGRSYRTGGYMAMWLASMQMIQFYDEDGVMLRTVNLGQDPVPVRQAA